MPKKVKLIINISLSVIMFFLLLFKLCRFVLNWQELSELWGFGEGLPSVQFLLVFFGDFVVILITLLGLWLRGAAAIVLSAVALCGSFVLYIIELILTYILTSQYLGFDPLVSVITNLIAMYGLIIAIADTVIRRKNKRKGSITQ